MDIFLIWCKVHVFPQESCLILTAGLVLLSSWGRCQVGPGQAAPCRGWARSWGWRQDKHSSALTVQGCSPMVFEPVEQRRTPGGNWDHLIVQWLSGTSYWWARAEAKLGNQVSRLGSKVQGWAQAYLPHSSGEDWGQSPELECSSQASGRETPMRLLTALTQGCKATTYQSRPWAQAAEALGSGLSVLSRPWQAGVQMGFVTQCPALLQGGDHSAPC